MCVFTIYYKADTHTSITQTPHLDRGFKKIKMGGREKNNVVPQETQRPLFSQKTLALAQRVVQSLRLSSALVHGDTYVT